MGEGVNLFPWHPALVRVQGSCAIIYEFQSRNAGLGIKKNGTRRGAPEEGRWTMEDDCARDTWAP